MKLKNIVIIQARLNSNRLPNKILRKIGNYSCLEILIKRLKKSKLVDRIIIASNKKFKNKKIFSKLNVDFFEMMKMFLKDIMIVAKI